jgi:hypothetical protein
VCAVFPAVQALQSVKPTVAGPSWTRLPYPGSHAAHRP